MQLKTALAGRAVEDVRTLICAAEHVCRQQRLEHFVAGVGVEPPEPLDLRPGQLQTRHFQVFSLDEMQPVGDSALIGGHCGH